MATKLDRKSLPSGTKAGDFVYVGRPASDQGDFGSEVGIADMACVNQFGEANNSKYYHAGVVQHTPTGRFYVYLEWGRIKGGNSWSGSFQGGDYQFVEASSEADARAFFAKQCNEKNLKRLVKTDIGGKMIWTAKQGDDGYLVQRLATRTRGLPDAYNIKDSSGVVTVVASTPVTKPTINTKTYQPQVVDLAKALVGGTRTYARAASSATGIVPTMAAIEEVRNECIPNALSLIASIGSDEKAQLGDSRLQALSRYVATIVPRPIPRGGDAMSILLNTSNILAIQQDLDAFESALKGEDFSTTKVTETVDPDSMLNANLRWHDPRSDGAWIRDQFLSMDSKRHSNFKNARILNIFEVSRPDRDQAFLQTVQRLANARKGQNLGDIPVGMQPASRPDVADIAPWVKDANVFLGIHGTRGVNVAPILGSHFRLPKSLSGVQITGAAFGHGVYFATVTGKSANYCGNKASAYGSGGNIAGRGYFMFLCDVAGGKFHYPTSAWGISDKCPGGGDSVYAHPRKVSSLQHDEHVIFDPTASRIRYVVELDW